MGVGKFGPGMAREAEGDGLEGLEKDDRIETTFSPGRVTHLTFTRAG